MCLSIVKINLLIKRECPDNFRQCGVYRYVKVYRQNQWSCINTAIVKPWHPIDLMAHAVQWGHQLTIAIQKKRMELVFKWRDTLKRIHLHLTQSKTASNNLTVGFRAMLCLAGAKLSRAIKTSVSFKCWVSTVWSLT